MLVQLIISEEVVPAAVVIKSLYIRTGVLGKMHLGHVAYVNMHALWKQLRLLQFL